MDRSRKKRPQPGFSIVITNPVDGDTVQPAFESIVLLQPRQVSEGLEKYFLGQIFRIATGAGAVVNHPENITLKPVHQAVECFPAALPGFLHQECDGIPTVGIGPLRAGFTHPGFRHSVSPFDQGHESRRHPEASVAPGHLPGPPWVTAILRCIAPWFSLKLSLIYDASLPAFVYNPPPKNAVGRAGPKKAVAPAAGLI